MRSAGSFQIQWLVAEPGEVAAESSSQLAVGPMRYLEPGKDYT